MSNDQRYFVIAQLHRTDLEDLGFDISNITDEQMLDIASDLGNAYRENSFWIDLQALADLRDDLRKQKG